MKLLLFLIAVYSLIIRETAFHPKKWKHTQAAQNPEEIQASRNQSHKGESNRYYQNVVVRMNDKRDRQSK